MHSLLGKYNHIKGGHMQLAELLLKEVKIEFCSNLSIDLDRLKEFIKKWPSEIFNIIIYLQYSKISDHYLYKLPNNEGILEFELDKKTKQLDVTFHPRQKVTFKTRFKHLLGEVFEDILSSKEHKKVRIKTVDDGDAYLTS